MKPILLTLLALSVFSATIISCSSPNERRSEISNGSNDSIVNRGKYLVNIIGCGDCHSPKVFGPMGPMEDSTRLLSGHPASMPVDLLLGDSGAMKHWILFNGMQTAVVGPWGVSFSANITSDATGIGNWKEEQFLYAMQHGKFMGLPSARMLLPPMPWTDYAKMNKADLKAIFAYLKSTKPVANNVPSPIPPNQLKAKMK